MRVLVLLFVLGTLVVGCGGDSNEPWQPNVTAIDAEGVWQMRGWKCVDEGDCPRRVLFGGHGYGVWCAEVDPDLVGAIVAIRDEAIEGIETAIRLQAAQAALLQPDADTSFLTQEILALEKDSLALSPYLQIHLSQSEQLPVHQTYNFMVASISGAAIAWLLCILVILFIGEQTGKHE